jgi:Methyltransferase FkbM domain
LKLDLQGYELQALHGAGSALDHVDAVLTEASFYAQSYEPSIAELISFFNDRGFDLHDIGAVAGRARDGRARQADLLFVRRGARLAMDRSWA